MNRVSGRRLYRFPSESRSRDSLWHFGTYSFVEAEREPFCAGESDRRRDPAHTVALRLIPARRKPFFIQLGKPRLVSAGNADGGNNVRVMGL